MGILAQRHTGNLSGGLTDAISLKSGSLLIPLANSSGVGILGHVVVIAQLTLGEGVLGNSHNAFCVNGAFALSNINGNRNDLALSIQCNRYSSNVSLGLGGIFILSVGAAHGNDHAQTSLGIGGVLILGILICLGQGSQEVGNRDGAGGLQFLNSGSGVVAVGILAQRHTGNLSRGLADAVLFKSGSLLIPLADSGRISVLGHVVIIAQLTLGEDVLGDGNNAFRNGSLALSYIKGNRNDLAILVKGRLANGNVSLRLGRVLVLSISAAHGNDHTKARLIGAGSGLGIRGGSRLFSTGNQRESHHCNQKNCNNFFHFLFLLN